MKNTGISMPVNKVTLPKVPGSDFIDFMGRMESLPEIWLNEVTAPSGQTVEFFRSEIGRIEDKMGAKDWSKVILGEEGLFNPTKIHDACKFIGECAEFKIDKYLDQIDRKNGGLKYSEKARESVGKFFAGNEAISRLVSVFKIFAADSDSMTLNSFGRDMQKQCRIAQKMSVQELHASNADDYDEFMTNFVVKKISAILTAQENLINADKIIASLGSSISKDENGQIISGLMEAIKDERNEFAVDLGHVLSGQNDFASLSIGDVSRIGMRIRDLFSEYGIYGEIDRSDSSVLEGVYAIRNEFGLPIDFTYDMCKAMGFSKAGYSYPVQYEGPGKDGTTYAFVYVPKVYINSMNSFALKDELQSELNTYSLNTSIIKSAFFQGGGYVSASVKGDGNSEQILRFLRNRIKNSLDSFERKDRFSVTATVDELAEKNKMVDRFWTENPIMNLNFDLRDKVRISKIYGDFFRLPSSKEISDNIEGSVNVRYFIDNPNYPISEEVCQKLLGSKLLGGSMGPELSGKKFIDIFKEYEKSDLIAKLMGNSHSVLSDIKNDPALFFVVSNMTSLYSMARNIPVSRDAFSRNDNAFTFEANRTAEEWMRIIENVYVNGEYVVLDTETTGVNKYFDSIIQFSGIAFGVNGAQRATLEKFIEPYKRRVSNEAFGIHRIDAEEKSRTEPDKFVGKSKDEMRKFLKEELTPFLNRKTIIAHNANFDMGMLKNLFYDYRLPLPEVRIIDTEMVLKSIMPGMRSYKLVDVYGSIVPSVEKKEFRMHDASGDVGMLSEIVRVIAAG